MAAVLANNGPRAYVCICKSKHKITMANLNQYMAKTLPLLVILMDDAIMFTCIWPFV